MQFYGQGYEDSDRRIPDISKARRLLKWEPKYDLNKTLEKTILFYVIEQKEKMSAGLTENAFDPQVIRAAHNS